MMDYEVFKSIVKGKFLSYMPPEYRDAAVDIRPVQKVNQTRDALTVYKGKGTVMAPTIYIDDIYGHYRECGSLEAALRDSAERYAVELENAKNCVPNIDIRHLKENVVMCLVNTEQNRGLLAGVPSREFHDLSVIYRWDVEVMPGVSGSITVSNEIAEMAGMTEEELFRHASENTRRISPVSIMPMRELMLELLPDEMKSMFMQESSHAEGRWVITNESRINGAVSMLFEENLHQLAEQIGDNLLLLPSSVHEVIAVPAGMAEGDPSELAELVHGINMDMVELEERLSNSVYCYDKDARTIVLAVESPEKRLDGREAELSLIQEDRGQR